MPTSEAIAAKAALSGAVAISQQGADRVNNADVARAVAPAGTRDTAKAGKDGKPANAKPLGPELPYKGVGQPLTKFRISVAVKDAKGNVTASANHYVDFEMAPARRSFFERQGQGVPGAEAGLGHNLKANIAKLNVPGSKPIPQLMGMGNETMEFVGAFIGYDEYSAANDADLTWDNPAFNPGVASHNGLHRKNAYDRAMQVAWAIRNGQQMVFQLEWGDDSSDFKIQYTRGTHFLGIIEDVTFYHAHEQRAYYKIKFYVTNRDDINTGADLGKPFKLPASLVAAIPTNGSASTLKTTQDERVVRALALGYIPPDSALKALGANMNNSSSEYQQQAASAFEAVKALRTTAVDVFDSAGNLKPNVTGPAGAEALVTMLTQVRANQKNDTPGGKEAREIADKMLKKAEVYKDMINDPAVRESAGQQQHSAIPVKPLIARAYPPEGPQKQLTWNSNEAAA